MLMLAAPTGESMLPAPVVGSAAEGGCAPSLVKGKLQTEFAPLTKALVEGFRRAVEGLRRDKKRVAYIKRRWKEIQAAGLPAVEDLGGDEGAHEVAVGGMEDEGDE